MFEYTNGAVGNSIIVEEALIFPIVELLFWLSNVRVTVDGFHVTNLSLSFLCCGPLRFPVTRASNSVVAAESRGISTLFEGTLDGRPGKEGGSPREEPMLTLREESEGGEPEVVVVV